MIFIRTLFIHLYILLLIISSSYCQQKQTIAVLPLSGSGIEDSEIAVLTDEVRAVLVETDKYNVLERDNMEDILVEQGFQLSGCVSEECAVQAGKMLGVQKMFTGSIGKIGSLYNINLRIFNVASSQIEKTVSARHDGPVEKLLDVISKAVYEISGSRVPEDLQQRMANRFGFFAGITFMTTTLHSMSKAGFAAGALYRYFILNKISVVPEVFFAGKGFEYYGPDEILTFENLQLALLFSTQLQPFNNQHYKFNIEAGPSVNYILNGTKENSQTIDLTNYDNGSAIKNLEYSLLLGTSFGVQLEKIHLYLKVNYELGLSEIFKNEESWEAGKSRVLYIMAGIEI